MVGLRQLEVAVADTTPADLAEAAGSGLVQFFHYDACPLTHCVRRQRACSVVLHSEQRLPLMKREEY